VITDDSNFHDAARVAVRNLWEDTTKKLGNPRVDQRKTPERGPSQESVETHRHDRNGALTSRINPTNSAHGVSIMDAP